MDKDKQKSIEDKYDGKDKRKTQGYLKEDKKQILRKEKENVSRLLDNYFLPKLHSRAWFPNGVYIIKKGYEYSDSGLGIFYERNNVESLRNLYEDAPSKKPKLKIKNDYIEYKYLKDDQYTVTIEYCANCEEHEAHTHHSADLYKNYALSIQKCIMLRFPFINVILKPIDTDIIKDVKFRKTQKKNGLFFEPMPLINSQFKEVRIGAMEIQISCKRKDNKEIQTSLIHSKLQTKKWPKISVILDKIVSFLPMFNGQICLYEKQENEDENETGDNADKTETEEEEEKNINDKSQNKKKSSQEETNLKNIEVNIYLYKNQKILQIMKDSEETIQNEMDPKKRKEMMKAKQYEDKANYFRPGTAQLVRNASASTLRPKSGVSFNSMGMDKMNTTNTILMSSFSEKCFGNNNNIIPDKSSAEKLKGKLVGRKYTDNNGYVNIGPLPYDSYLIEVMESNQFKYSAMVLNFNQIEPSDTVITKYIGLLIQDNAFLRVHVYETVKNDKDEDIVHVTGSKVTLKYCKDEGVGDDEDGLGKDVTEFKIEIDESSEGGIYEHIVKPGRYLLEATKNNYELVRKFFDLKKGMNSINVEMYREKSCHLKILVYNYIKFRNSFAENNTDSGNEPIKNAGVSIYKNNRDIIFEGITNKKGEVSYIISKNQDFLNIVVNKLGYLPAQRTFYRSKSEDIPEEGEYTATLVVLLVKENLIYEQGFTTIITYGLVYDDCLEPDMQIHQNEENIFVEWIDQQKNLGILTAIMKYNESNDNNNVTNSENHENIDHENEYEELISLHYLIKSEMLQETNYQDKGFTMNGLERYNFETIIYTPKNMFYMPAPKACDKQYNYWNLGWIDLKNNLFYQTSLLLEIKLERVQFFEEFVEFLQKILNEKIYKNLFKFFGFDKGILQNSDRFIYPEIIKKKMIKLKFTDNDDAITIITEMFKHSNQMSSFNTLKKKILANLKNFKEEVDFNQSKNNTSIENTKSRNDLDNTNNIKEGEDNNEEKNENENDNDNNAD